MVSLEYMPRSGTAGHMVVLCLVFKETSVLFSIVAVLIYIPTNSVRGFPSLHSLSKIYCVWILWRWPFWPVWGHYSFDLLAGIHCIAQGAQLSALMIWRSGMGSGGWVGGQVGRGWGGSENRERDIWIPTADSHLKLTHHGKAIITQ